MEGAPRRVIAMDEAGNTGENLLDEDQPVFAIGAVDISIADAEALVNPILREAGVAELKFSRLRRSNAGRRNILRLVQGAAERGRVCLTAAHKPWMLAAKLVDELVEQTMLARGQQAVWYASGQHVEMTERLYADGPRALGELYEDLARTFVPLVRDYSSEFATEFLAVLRRCRIACRDDGVKEILDLMVDTEPGLAHEFDEREDALDPAVTLVWFEGGYWSQKLREPFEIVHDDSATVQRWQDRLWSAPRES